MEAIDAGAVPAIAPPSERVRCCTRCRAIYRSDFARCPNDGAEIATLDGDPLVGTTLGEHYAIEACVAEGAMGRVYRAHHVRLERKQFAVKVLLGDLASTMAMRLRFAQEADAASSLDHPNVVPVLDYGKSTSGLLYLVMDFVSGPTLASLIASEGRLAPDRTVAMARSLCLGLAHAHDRGLVHRDFKPDNVIVTRGDTGELPRIVDFGLAITAGPSADATRLTNVGIAVGTPVYAAPEQTTGGDIDHRADLFALGITMYEMLAGITPFSGNVAEVVYLNATAEAPPIAQRAPGVVVGPALERIVSRLMHRDRDRRFADAREVLEALDRLDIAVGEARPARGRSRPGWSAQAARAPTEEMPAVEAPPDEPPAAEAAAPEPSPPAPTLPRPRRARAWVLVAVAVLAAAVAIGVGALPRLQGDGGRDGVAAAASAPPVPETAVAVNDPPAIVPPAIVPPAIVPPAIVPPAPDDEPAAAAEDPQPRRASSRRESADRRERERGTADRAATAASSANLTAADPAVVEPTAPSPPPAGGPAVAITTAAEPRPLPAAPPTPAPKVAPSSPPRVVDARVTIARFDLHGSLSDSVVRRAIERELAQVAACYRTAATRAGRSPAGATHVTLTIDEGGQVRGVRASGSPLPGLDACIAGSLDGLRTRSAPDVGTVTVSFDLTLRPEGS